MKSISAIPVRARSATFVVVAALACGGAPACHRARPAAGERATTADAETQRLRAALAEIPVSAAPADPAVSALQRRLVALYRARPAAAADAVALVRDERALRGKIVLDALTLAGTPESAAALTAIASDAATPAGARDYALTCVERLRGKAPAPTPHWSARGAR